MMIEPHQFDEVKRRHPDLVIGYTSGVFDLFHKGHQHYLETCRKNCGVLIVGVDSDRMTRDRKGYPRPIQGIAQRMLNVNRHAHYVFLKDASSEHYATIFRPNVYFFSKDNMISAEKHARLAVNPDFRNAIFIPYTQDVSTTEIIQACLNAQTNNEAAGEAGTPAPASRTIS